MKRETLSPIRKLLTIASPPIVKHHVIGTDTDQFLKRWGNAGKELGDLLIDRNGFYGYESALLVRPFHNDIPPLGIVEWNASELWKCKYSVNSDLDDALFFAEDVFGTQFCFFQGRIWTFDPETGIFTKMSQSLRLWAKKVLGDFDFWTGFPLAHTWQLQNSPLPAGVRLLPKTPFVCGGEYEYTNLYPIEDVKGMLFRASIANQIRDLPDGSQIILRVEGEATGKDP